MDVPGITYDPRWLNQLGVFVGSLRNVKAIDVLPYHDMGKIKYEKLGVPYPLSDTLPLERDALLKAREYVLDGVRQARQ